MIQKFINIIYRYPKSRYKTVRRFGGIFNYIQMNWKKKEMKKSYRKLKPIVSDPQGLPIYFLTGKDYFYQTLFCIHSLLTVSIEKFELILVDDGTFDKRLIDEVHKLIINCNIITKEQIDFNLERQLPSDVYPVLHKKRKEYPHIKKLIDIHTIPLKPWKLVFDSDMLFFSKPVEIIDWLQAPRMPLYMVDSIEAYGYSRPLMEELAKSSIKKKVNVGLIGLNSKSIDWNSLEKWVKVLQQKEGNSYFLEQALSAMLLGDKPAIRLDETEYIVNPGKNQVQQKAGILHHYVDLSKEYYFKIAWQKFKHPK
ncbi:hypothetical protein D3C87_685690 [compost metagenome]